VFGPNGKNYSNNNADFNLSRIGIDITKEGKDQTHEGKCHPGQWTTVHWVGRLMDGRVVTDSRAEPGGVPKTFALGASEVFKCWDLAIPQLHNGDHATISCPAAFAYGNAWTQAPLGGEPIPLGSDMVFDIEIEDCNHAPDHNTKREIQPVTTTMQPDQCFYLHMQATEHTAFDFVLSTEAENYADWWAAKYAIIEHKVVDDESQQWYYDETTKSIHNAADPTYFLDHDMGWAMIAKIGDKKSVAKNFPKEKRQWYFDPIYNELTTEIDGVHSAMTLLAQPRNWESV
jgi:hypothetical protein